MIRCTTYWNIVLPISFVTFICYLVSWLLLRNSMYVCVCRVHKATFNDVTLCTDAIWCASDSAFVPSLLSSLNDDVCNNIERIYSIHWEDNYTTFCEGKRLYFFLYVVHINTLNENILYNYGKTRVKRNGGDELPLKWSNFSKILTKPEW